MAEQIESGGQVSSKEAPSIRMHRWELKTGITCTPEFQKKGLATHAINVGTKCDHDMTGADINNGQPERPNAFPTVMTTIEASMFLRLGQAGHTPISTAEFERRRQDALQALVPANGNRYHIRSPERCTLT